MSRPGGPWWRRLSFLIGAAIVLALLLKMFVVQPFVIPSESMQNTVRMGDRVLVDKLSVHLRGVHRGDVVVFDGAGSFAEDGTGDGAADGTGGPGTTPAAGGLRGALRSVASWFGVAPPAERDFVKRVIGVGGDRVRCCDPAGRITVNGKPLDEPYLYPGDAPSADRFDVAVPRGRLWVLGDHRSIAEDSRDHLGGPGGGFVPVGKVIGRAVAVYWPWRHRSTLPVPAAFARHG